MTLLRLDRGAEQAARHARDLGLLLGERARPRHRGRRPDAAQILRLAALSHAPHEQRDVGALPAAIRVQLVEHEERQPLRGPNDRPVDRAA